MKVLSSKVIWVHALTKAHTTFFLLTLLPMLISITGHVQAPRIPTLQFSMLVLVIYASTYWLYFLACILATKRRITRNIRYRDEFTAASDVEKGRMIGGQLVPL